MVYFQNAYKPPTCVNILDNKDLQTISSSSIII